MCGGHIERNSTNRCRRIGLAYQRAGGALLVRTHSELLFCGTPSTTRRAFRSLTTGGILTEPQPV